MDKTVVIPVLLIILSSGVSVYFGYISYYRVNHDKLEKMFLSGDKIHRLYLGRFVFWLGLATAFFTAIVIFWMYKSS